MDFTDGLKAGVLNSIILSASLLFAVGCAEIARPPGGEVDKTSPGIISSSPLNGSVNVAPGNVVTIRFSERIQKPPENIKSIFISPRQENEPEIKWNSDNLELIFADSFKTDQTYIISLAGTVKDLRNNPVDSNSIIAFTTGAVIDTGYVSGTVLDNDKPASGLTVGLFPDDLLFDPSDGYGLGSWFHLKDSVYPDYIAQTNREGFFSFKYLPPKKYYLIAFEDLNKNEFVEWREERFAVPDRHVHLDLVSKRENLTMRITKDRPGPTKVVSASVTRNKMLRVVLDDLLETEHVKRAGARLDSHFVGAYTNDYILNDFVEVSLEKSSQFNFSLEGVNPGTYILDFHLGPSAKLVIPTDTIVVGSIEDNYKPEIYSFTPDLLPIFVEDFKPVIAFTEQIDTSKLTASTFTIWENDTTFYPMEIERYNTFSLELNSDKIEKGKKYTTKISEFEIFDLAGNVLGDSVALYTFEFMDRDSLGSISGNVVMEAEYLQNNPVVLEFTKQSNGQLFTQEILSGSFKIDVPAGKYLISGYVDSDTNNVHDLGSLNPYSYSETYQKMKDTITVRSRFETTGVVFEFK